MKQFLDKRILIGVAVILVVIAIVVLAQNNKLDTTAQPSNEKKQEVFDPYNPNFVTGEVVAVSGDQIELKVGIKSYSVRTTTQTSYMKQVKKGKNIELASSSMGDLKAKQTIMAFFSKNPEGNIYQADKIQIISQ